MCCCKTPKSIRIGLIILLSLCLIFNFIPFVYKSSSTDPYKAVKESIKICEALESKRNLMDKYINEETNIEEELNFEEDEIDGLEKIKYIESKYNDAFNKTNSFRNLGPYKNCPYINKPKSGSLYKNLSSIENSFNILIFIFTIILLGVSIYFIVVFKNENTVNPKEESKEKIFKYVFLSFLIVLILTTVLMLIYIILRICAYSDFLEVLNKKFLSNSSKFEDRSIVLIIMEIVVLILFGICIKFAFDIRKEN